MAAVVPAFHLERTRDRTAGTCAAYLLRSVLVKAGRYVPGVQERLFFDLSRRTNGSTLDSVVRWFQANGGMMARIGYEMRATHVALPAPKLLPWVAGGNGLRAAILRVDRTVLHPPSASAKGVFDYCVGIVHKQVNGVDVAGLADPWPEDTLESTIPASLEEAHRRRNFQALVMHAPGWS